MGNSATTLVITSKGIERPPIKWWERYRIPRVELFDIAIDKLPKYFRELRPYVANGPIDFLYISSKEFQTSRRDVGTMYGSVPTLVITWDSYIAQADDIYEHRWLFAHIKIVECKYKEDAVKHPQIQKLVN
jgi:hypothetical protein